VCITGDLTTSYQGVRVTQLTELSHWHIQIAKESLGGKLISKSGVRHLQWWSITEKIAALKGSMVPSLIFWTKITTQLLLCNTQQNWKVKSTQCGWLDSHPCSWCGALALWQNVLKEHATSSTLQKQRSSVNALKMTLVCTPSMSAPKEMWRNVGRHARNLSRKKTAQPVITVLPSHHRSSIHDMATCICFQASDHSLNAREAQDTTLSNIV